MKKFIFFFVITLLFVYQKQDSVRDFFYPPIDYAAAHEVPVIMYGTSWCGYCAKTRVLLEQHDITYFEYDVETSDEGYEQYIDLGGRGVPVLQIGGKVVKGYNPSRILELVNDI
ncbi:MAG: glutaredoxin family protein [Desulfofustis sp.]|nr:glutaredoxin family protein [Desulfofustis sp.]